MVRYRRRHNKVVQKLAEELNGEWFNFGAFDIITAEPKFIEVKVCNGMIPKFKISEDELKVARIMGEKYLVYFYYHGEQHIIQGSKILEWARNPKYENQFGHKHLRQKDITLSKKRFAEL